MTVQHWVMSIEHDLSGFDLNLLVAFSTLAREGSVTRAARRLGVTQSAMSHTLRRLRDAIGDPLMVRVGQGMELTPRGEALVLPVRRALADLRHALVSPEDFDPARAERTFRLASIDLFDTLRMPALLGRLRTEAPGIRLVVAPRFAADPRGLETGDLDLAVRARSMEPGWVEPPESPGLVERTLLRGGYGCYLRRDHPALVDGHLTLDAFVSGSHLLVSPTGEGGGVTDRMLADRGLVRTIALRLPEFAACLDVVEASDLILTAPTSLRVQLHRYPGVVSVAPPLEIPGTRLALVWHERFTGDPAHAWMRDLLAWVAAGFEE